MRSTFISLHHKWKLFCIEHFYLFFLQSTHLVLLPARGSHTFITLRENHHKFCHFAVTHSLRSFSFQHIFVETWTLWSVYHCLFSVTLCKVPKIWCQIWHICLWASYLHSSWHQCVKTYKHVPQQTCSFTHLRFNVLWEVPQTQSWDTAEKHRPCFQESYDLVGKLRRVHKSI